MQKLIAERIVKARKERKLTQKELARLVGKQASNISDIEVSRVQVSAVDLYAISEALGKPIEYFYGMISENGEVEDLVFALRHQSEVAQQQSIKFIQAWNSLHQLKEKVETDNRQLTTGESEQFVKDFMIFLVQIDASYKASLEIRQQFKHFLADQGLDLDKLLGTSE